VVVVLGLVLPSTARAQLPPLAEAVTQYMPPATVEEAGGVNAQITSYDALVNVPTRLARTTFFIPGLQFHVDSISYANEPPSFTPVRSLIGLDLTLLLAHQLNDTTTLSFRVWPGVAGDLKKLDAGALRVGGLGMLSWAPSERVTLGGGALASYSFGQLLPLPMLYLDWTPRRYLRVEASLPFFASTTFRWSDRLELGALADVSGNEYAIRSAEVRDRYPCVGGRDDATTPVIEGRASPGNCTDHLAYSVVAVGAIARVRLFSSLWLGAFFGHTVFRRYDLKNPDGGRLPGGEVDMPNVPVFRLGFTFRIPSPEAPPASTSR